MMTLPSRLAHHRMTAPQPCREESQVMTTMWAEPVSPARKAAWRVLGTKGHRGQPRVAKSSRTPRIKAAASLTAGWREMNRSKSGSESVPMMEEKRAVKGRT